MKRLVVYYSLSGNTKEAAEDIAKALDADLVRLDTVKPMPKSYAAQILVGGGQVAMNKIPKIKKIDTDINAYDEIILGTPVWNSKGVPAVNAFLKDSNAANKVKSVFIFSAGGDIKKCTDALVTQLPNLKYTVSLLDKKHVDSVNNKSKIEGFVADIKAME